MADVLDYSKPEPRRLTVPTALLFALPGFWVAYILPPLGLLILPVTFIAIIVLPFLGRWKVVALTLLLSPMSLHAAIGVTDYCAGTGRLKCKGLMRGDRNVLPDSRLKYSSGGCIVFGNEWMYQDPYNVALLSMIRCFGPMPGSYDGPYPDETTALAALVGAPTLDLRDFAADRFSVGGTPVALTSGLGERLLKGFSEGPATNILDLELLTTYGTAQAVRYGPRCVIVAIPGRKPRPVLPADPRVLLLIDARTGKAFAAYRDRTLVQFSLPSRTIWN